MPTTTQPFDQLSPHDLAWCVHRLPKIVRDRMKVDGEKLVLAGGYIRSVISREPIADIDLFTTSQDQAADVALILADAEPRRVHRTDNAFTVRGINPMVQIIHRWVFAKPEDVVPSFDFTVARAAIWWEPPVENVHKGKWQSLCDPDYYADLAAKRLIYRQPVRIEEAGGSLLRVLKFYSKGYRIPLDSLGEVLARAVAGIDPKKLSDGQRDVANGVGGAGTWERQIAHMMTGLLREVDPLIDPDHITHLPSEADATAATLEDDAQGNPTPQN